MSPLSTSFLSTVTTVSYLTSAEAEALISAMGQHLVSTSIVSLQQLEQGLIMLKSFTDEQRNFLARSPVATSSFFRSHSVAAGAGSSSHSQDSEGVSWTREEYIHRGQAYRDNFWLRATMAQAQTMWYSLPDKCRSAVRLLAARAGVNFGSDGAAAGQALQQDIVPVPPMERGSGPEAASPAPPSSS